MLSVERFFFVAYEKKFFGYFGFCEPYSFFFRFRVHIFLLYYYWIRDSNPVKWVNIWREHSPPIYNSIRGTARTKNGSKERMKIIKLNEKLNFQCACMCAVVNWTPNRLYIKNWYTYKTDEMDADDDYVWFELQNVCNLVLKCV